jgi:hypothetical protein
MGATNSHFNPENDSILKKSRGKLYSRYISLTRNSGNNEHISYSEKIDKKLHRLAIEDFYSLWK